MSDVQAALKRFEDLHPDEISLSLYRILDVLDTLGRPQDKLPPVIHVAGTNGKGSTCAFMRAIAEAAGLSVHVFTSPHLVRFNERIRLAGKLVEDAPLIDWLTRTYDALQGREITHFEATTAAAILAFSEVPADLMILEVGLGGRFDATNVIDAPALSVITPIDYDHQQFLGSDLAGIAAEKAGIVKAGCPVVSAQQVEICADVITSKAEALAAPLTFVGAAEREQVPARLGLTGPHQRANAALAVLAMQALPGFDVSDSAIHLGLAHATWPARLQRLVSGPLTDHADGVDVWLDGGHNPHAAAAIANEIQSWGGRTIMVAAMMASKDHAGYFAPFADTLAGVHTCPNAPGHQGENPADLAKTANRFIPNATAHPHFAAAFEAALSERPDRIFIGGSLYLAGEVLALNQELPV